MPSGPAKFWRNTFQVLAILCVGSSMPSMAEASGFLDGDVAGLSPPKVFPQTTVSAGPVAPADPLQSPIKASLAPIVWGAYRIVPVARFHIRALVLSRKLYSAGDMGKLVPVDLALGWGKMSDPSWIRHIDISQDQRQYHWSFPEGTKITREGVITQSANMHMMPAQMTIRKVLLSVRRGDVVTIDGDLVDVRLPGKGHWNSSLTRDDTGPGSCELILVSAIKIEKQTGR